MKKDIKYYEKKFSSKDRELLIATSCDSCMMFMLKFNIMLPSVCFLSSVNTETGKRDNSGGTLVWFNNNKNFYLKAFTVYRVKCRPILDKKPLKDYPLLNTNYYLLTEIVECDVKNQELEKAIEEDRKSRTFSDAKYGEFVLDRTLGMYVGSCDWLGEKCRLCLEWDDTDESCQKKCLELFEKSLQNASQCDKKLKAAIAEEINGDYGEFSIEKIMQNLVIEEVAVFSNNEFNYEYNCGDLFYEECFYYVAVQEGKIVEMGEC